MENDLASYFGQSFTLEYRKYQDYQAKNMITVNDALKYKKDHSPLIILLSIAFFDLLWKTANKQTILKVITNYSTKSILHIWLDVDENVVKHKSTLLARTDAPFTRIMMSELQRLTSRARIIKIYNLLSEKTSEFYSFHLLYSSFIFHL